jgi:dihydrofolate reductase
LGDVIVHMFTSLDGVMQAPGEPDEDLEGGFAHGGWQVPFLDEESGKLMSQHYQDADALLLGRKTYEIFAPYWSRAPADNPFASLMNGLPKYVASRTLHAVTWNNSWLIVGDLADEVVRLKEDYPQVHVSGSGDLLQTLLRHDLVDRMHLWVYPVLLGTGKRVFRAGTIPAALRLVDSTTFGTGAVLLTYDHVGRPTYGTMALDETAGT